MITKSNWLIVGVIVGVAVLFLSFVMISAPRHVSAQTLPKATQSSPEIVSRSIYDPPVVNLPAGRKFLSIIYASEATTRMTGYRRDIYVTTIRPAEEPPRRIYLDVAGNSPGSMETKVIIQEH